MSAGGLVALATKANFRAFTQQSRIATRGPKRAVIKKLHLDADGKFVTSIKMLKTDKFKASHVSAGGIASTTRPLRITVRGGGAQLTRVGGGGARAHRVRGFRLKGISAPRRPVIGDEGWTIGAFSLASRNSRGILPHEPSCQRDPSRIEVRIPRSRCIPSPLLRIHRTAWRPRHGVDSRPTKARPFHER